MPVEIATYISDLVASNPPTSDLETQGANHLQLIKTVLQNVFGITSRRFVGLPQVVSLSSSGALGAGVTNATILVNTSGGAVSLTLPTLLSTDAGWECSFIKTTTDLNPIFVLPPSGTIQSGEYAGLAKARRCIPGRRSRCIWTGTGFIIDRTNYQPIGSTINNPTSALPVGYEWPNGQTLAGVLGSLYPEYFAVFGGLITPDMRGRAEFGLDNMGGAAANRITVAGGNFDGTVVGGVGGAQNHTLLQAELPAVIPTFTGTLIHLGTLAANEGAFVQANGGGTPSGAGGLADDATGATPHITIPDFTPAGTISAIGGGGSHTILPPAMIMGKLLVVE